MEIAVNIQRIVLNLLIVFLLCSVLIWFSVFSYGLLYYLYIPAIAHVKPVYLQHDTYCTKDQRCRNPFANVSLTENNNYELLTRGQAYAIELVLDMPESECNLRQGMFMIRFDMLSQYGQILQTSKRPAVLRYKSPLFRIIYTLLFIPAMLFGYFDERQTLTIPLFEQFVEYNPIHHIYIEIEAQTAEIYSSTLKIHAQFTGLRYMMYYWPIFSFIIGVGSNFFVGAVIFIFIWIRQEMNAIPSPNRQLVHEKELKSIEEIRKAVRQMQFETQEAGASGIQRSPESLETLSPHKD